MQYKHKMEANRTLQR